MTEVENAKRCDHLKDELRRMGAPFLVADGRSPDGAHRERGFAIPLEPEAAVRLAIKYEQEALFWFDGESFHLVGALSERKPVHLPIDEDARP